ncbi:hypothetical protein Acid345_3194 [Candidatus Koribacter versatilis Ellin345]|uniref:Right handed beta helix domain-containing protein n=1 Tax=Koribacter versatilis (strain Ellin345) TaxID=204669 RepID=Q1ILQ5_KORVE|nr:hypothetical protein Acid345_3194 [Candidatus Koribacter versatilis Ellin345]
MAKSGDGSAANPYKGWESALEADGAVVQFRPGHYFATRTVNLHGPVDIDGKMAIIHKVSAGAAFAINGVPGSQTSEFVIRDIRIDGGDQGDVGITVGNGSGPVYSANGLLENIGVHGFKKAGIWLQAAQIVTMMRVEAYSNGTGFLFAGSAGANTTVNSYGCRAFQNGIGVEIDMGHGLNFNGLTSESNRFEGVKIVSQGRSVRQVHFNGCWLEQNNKARPNSKASQFSVDGEAVEGLVLEDTTFAIAGSGNQHFSLGRSTMDKRVQNLHLQSPDH